MSSLVVKSQSDNNNYFTSGWFEFVTCWPTQDSAPLKNLNVDAQFLPDEEVLTYSEEELLDLVYGDVLKRRLLFSAIRAYEKKLKPTDEQFDATHTTLKQKFDAKFFNNQVSHATIKEDKDEARRQLGFLDFPASLQEFAKCSFKPRDVTIHACLDWKRKVNDKSWCKLDTDASFQNPLIIDFSKKLVNDILLRFDMVSDFISALAVAVKCNPQSLKLWIDFSNNSSFGDTDRTVSRIPIDQSLLTLMALDNVEFVDIRSTMLATIRRRDFFQTIPLKLLEKLIWIPTVLVDSPEEWSDMYDVVERKQRIECSTRAHRVFSERIF
jgi:hypothetical protein